MMPGDSTANDCGVSSVCVWKTPGWYQSIMPGHEPPFCEFEARVFFRLGFCQKARIAKHRKQAARYPKTWCFAKVDSVYRMAILVVMLHFSGGAAKQQGWNFCFRSTPKHCQWLGFLVVQGGSADSKAMFSGSFHYHQASPKIA